MNDSPGHQPRKKWKCGVRRRSQRYLARLKPAPKRRKIPPSLPIENVLSVLSRIPYGWRQRAASLVWWDFFAERKSPPELLALVNEPVMLARYPLDLMVPWLVAMGYSTDAAIKRVQPPNETTDYMSLSPYA